MGTINGARKDYVALGPVPALDGPGPIHHLLGGTPYLSMPSHRDQGECVWQDEAGVF